MVKMKKLAFIVLLFCGHATVPDGYVLIPKSEVVQLKGYNETLHSLLRPSDTSEREMRLENLYMRYNGEASFIEEWESQTWYFVLY